MRANDSGLSRRTLLKGIGSVGLAAAGPKSFAGTESLAAQAGATSVPAQDPAPSPVAPAVTSFALTDVDLLDSPFLKARTLEQQYLLSLEPDRMLHQFRVNARTGGQTGRIANAYSV